MPGLKIKRDKECIPAAAEIPPFHTVRQRRSGFCEVLPFQHAVPQCGLLLAIALENWALLRCQRRFL